MKWLIGIFLLVSIIYGQDLLESNKSYKFDSAMVVLSVSKFNVLDSLLKESDLLREKNKLYKNRKIVTDSLEKESEFKIENLNLQVELLNNKATLFQEREDLINEKVVVYKTLFEDTQKAFYKKKGKRISSNKSFWFGLGTVVGVVAVYVSSATLNNMK